MDAEELERRSTSYGAVAESYDRYRPDYPAEAVAWLSGAKPARVLELGSGTGKLTRGLLSLGHSVVATDVSPAMLEQLKARLSAAHLAVSRAEAIPLATSSVDIVVSAQAFHWFDKAGALAETARVLAPGGTLGLVWNMADLKVPWVRRVMTLLSLSDELPEDPLAGSDLFSTREKRSFRHWQRFDRESLLGFVASHSYAAMLSAEDRAALLDEVGAVYDSYGRGHQGMLMPWQARCFRATVSELAARSDDAPDDGLLIDFS